MHQAAGRLRVILEMAFVGQSGINHSDDECDSKWD
jgi:hypothetical protein